MSYHIDYIYLKYIFVRYFFVFFVLVAKSRIKLDLENRRFFLTRVRNICAHTTMSCIIFIFLFSPTNLYSAQASFPNGDVVVCSRLMSAKEIF